MLITITDMDGKKMSISANDIKAIRTVDASLTPLGYRDAR